MQVALVRPPPPALEQGERSFVPRRGIALAKALAQHAAYRAALTAAGVEVVELAVEPELADSAFVEDAALVLDEVAIELPMGAPSRRPEAASVAAALARYREVVRLEGPGRMDGGDVLRVGDTLYVGQSTRTDHAALKALAHRVLGLGYRVKAVAVAGCLHLETACTYLGDDALVCDPARIDPRRFGGLRAIAVHPAEPGAANVLRVGERLLCPASGPRTAERLAREGFAVELVDVSEFEKAEAGLTCLGLVFDAR